MKKKAQIQTHLFIYIAAIIMVALILLFGYRAISNFVGKGEQATLLSVEQDLVSEVDRVSVSFGEVSIREFNFPGKYSALCLVDSSVVEGAPGDTSGLYASQLALMNDYPLLQGAIESGSESNVFLIKDGVSESFSDVGLVQITSGFKCVNLTRGSARLRFDWKGRGVVQVRACSFTDLNCETEI
ncbi:MAG: hypothetical protein U9R08_05455 [Nanoarchaeota archaeon]|nr:hypothetical protein [Nanoarchaeota archaeon]